MRHFDFADKLPGSYYWYLGGDVHEGNAWYDFGRHRTKFLDYLKRIMLKRKNTYLSLQGDNIEAIPPNDKRFKLVTDDSRTKPRAQRTGEQVTDFLEDFTPYADKILYVGMGNHEMTLINVDDFAKQMADRLGVPYSTYTAVVDTGQFSVVDWHGDGYLQSQAFMDPQVMYENECRSVKKRLARLGVGDTDLIRVVHHFHKNRLVEPGQYLRGYTEGGDLKTYYSYPIKKFVNEKSYVYDVHDRYYVASGCLWGGYIEGGTDYCEQRGFNLNELGWQYIEVKNDKLVGIKVDRM